MGVSVLFCRRELSNCTTRRSIKLGEVVAESWQRMWLRRGPSRDSFTS